MCLLFKASDGLASVSQRLKIISRNTAPYLYHPILLKNGILPLNFTMHFSDRMHYAFDLKTFQDDDITTGATNDPITYRAYQTGQSSLPAWLKFDQSARNFQATPSIDPNFILGCPSSSLEHIQVAVDYWGNPVYRRMCSVRIVVEASDGQLTCAASFLVSVYNAPPYQRSAAFSNTFNLSNPHALYYHVDSRIEYTISLSHFVEADIQDAILYSP